MNIAFYAPMKSPDDPRPSGDRTIGRLLMAALTAGGHDVRLVSQLRTWSGAADAARLTDFQAAAVHEAAALVDTYKDRNGTWRPDLWFTYHSYYKAPDLIGPSVADALGLPYVITEASYSARRGQGPWADWLAAARASIEAADAIFSFTARDRVGLADICSPERLHDLAPFLDLNAFDLDAAPPITRSHDDPVRLVVVAMMRPGAKLESYQLLGSALAHLKARAWHLDIVGDGAARPAVEAAFAGVPGKHVTWHGRLDASAIRKILSDGDVFVWPGVDEAFGMAYLEAQAFGLPVVALRTAGVPEVVHDGETGCLVDIATPEALAVSIAQLMDDPALRKRLGAGARASIIARHSLTTASAQLTHVLRHLSVSP